MTQYLLIESRDPFVSATVAEHADLAIRLKQAGNGVAVFLTQNGVFPVRAEAQHGELARLLDARVEVFADEFALRERGIAPPDALASVKPAAIDLVIDRLLSGWTVVWH